MSKFRVSLKLTGLELMIEGTRDDVPAMAQAVGHQMAGLLSGGATVIEAEPHIINAPELPVQDTMSPRRKPSKRSARAGTNGGSGSDDQSVAEILNWKHDPAKWGTPDQKWTTNIKALWLLYVVSKELTVDELSSRAIANTFNKHLRQAGLLRVGNISRDLGRLKGMHPAWVGENTTVSPSCWFLTHEGTRQAEIAITKLREHRQPSE
jgi:hypothetical protein